MLYVLGGLLAPRSAGAVHSHSIVICCMSLRVRDDVWPNGKRHAQTCSLSLTIICIPACHTTKFCHIYILCVKWAQWNTINMPYCFERSALWTTELEASRERQDQQQQQQQQQAHKWTNVMEKATPKQTTRRSHKGERRRRRAWVAMWLVIDLIERRYTHTHTLKCTYIHSVSFMQTHAHTVRQWVHTGIISKLEACITSNLPRLHVPV